MKGNESCYDKKTGKQKATEAAYKLVSTSYYIYYYS